MALHKSTSTMNLLASAAAWRKRDMLVCLCLSIAVLAAARSMFTPPANALTSPRLRFSDTRSRKTSRRSGTSPCKRVDSLQLQVYVYDLPHRFTFGMIAEYHRARGIEDDQLSAEYDAEAIPPYPAHQHASEWWLFQSLFKTEELKAAAKDASKASKDQRTMRTRLFESNETYVNQQQEGTAESLGALVPEKHTINLNQHSVEAGADREDASSGAYTPFHMGIANDSVLQGHTEVPSSRKNLLSDTSTASKGQKMSAYSSQHVLSSAAVRVSNPEDADIIFVPFFSSLSLIVRPLKKVRSEVTVDASLYSDVAAQQALMDWVEQQEPWKQSNGRDHVFVASDPAAMSEVHLRTKNSLLLVADFGRLKSDEASLQKDVVIPYVHRVPTFPPQDEREVAPERSLLLFFAGNRFRKEGGTIRTKLFDVLAEEESVSMVEGVPSAEGRRAAMKGMRTSKFCLSPAGDTPSACRLFDAIVNLCVPVVVSDQIELPFEDRLDYSTFALFIPETKALEPGYLASTLREEIASGGWASKQRVLREVRSLFEYSEPYGAVDMVWEKIATKVPAMREAMHREARNMTT